MLCLHRKLYTTKAAYKLASLSSMLYTVDMAVFSRCKFYKFYSDFTVHEFLSYFPKEVHKRTMKYGHENPFKVAILKIEDPRTLLCICVVFNNCCNYIIHS